jgi:uncharacterized protein (TIGR00288 family)
MEQRKKIALLIDYDNFNQEKYFPILFEELDELGDVILKYAFYSNLKDSTINDKFIKLGIQPMSQLAYTKGKNAVDIRMTIEAVSLLNKTYVDTICIATNDSDFTPLVYHLKENNKYVIGAGDNKASQSYINVFHEFISVEKITTAKIEKESYDIKDSALLNLVEVIKQIVENNQDDRKMADFSGVIQALKSQMKDFNPKNYGATNNKTSTFFQQHLKKYFDVVKEGTVFYVKIK